MILRKRDRPLTRHPLFRGYLRLCPACIAQANAENAWKLGVMALAVAPERCDCRERVKA